MFIDHSPCVWHTEFGYNACYGPVGIPKLKQLGEHCTKSQCYLQRHVCKQNTLHHRHNTRLHHIVIVAVANMPKKLLATDKTNSEMADRFATIYNTIIMWQQTNNKVVIIKNSYQT